MSVNMLTASRPSMLLKRTDDDIEHLDPREKVLHRPTAYAGSIVQQSSVIYLPVVEHVDGKEQTVIRPMLASYVPAQLTIFGELIANASDQHQDFPDQSDTIKFFSDENNEFTPKDKPHITGWNFTVYNTCSPFPLGFNKKLTNVRSPEACLAHLNTGTNYTETRKKKIGQNGVGAKLANIFSKHMYTEIYNAELGQLYTQWYHTNMSIIDPPVIKNYRKGKASYFLVRVWPDTDNENVFKKEFISPTLKNILYRRALDLAGTTKCKIYWNGTRIPISGFKKYIGLFIPDEKIVSYMADQTWEVAIARPDPAYFQLVEDNNQKDLQQLSFVNHMWTIKGGTHVTAAINPIVKAIQEYAEQKHQVKLSNAMIKKNLWIFINVTIEDPDFEGQAKLELTTELNKITKPVYSDSFLRNIFNSQIVKDMIDDMEMQMERNAQNLTLKQKKVKGRTLGAGGKVEGASWAGDPKMPGPKILIPVEGDSAKALAMAARTVLPYGTERVGIIPFRGKSLNSAKHSLKKLLKNSEIQAFIQEMGLVIGKQYAKLDELPLEERDKYVDVKELRYDQIWYFTDADPDGAHITGLLLLLVAKFWPSLFKIKGVLFKVVTPVWVASKGAEVKEFFSESEYADWLTIDPSHSTWHAEQYKGLGTSTSTEGKKYFRNLNRYLKPFVYNGVTDIEKLFLFFDKHTTEIAKRKKKEWLKSISETQYIRYQEVEAVSFNEFVDFELSQYAHTSNRRCLPHLVSGLKNVMTKILEVGVQYVKQRVTNVDSYAGMLKEYMDYHHGPVAAVATIIGMAQDYIGSNNLNLLYPKGQYGTRHGTLKNNKCKLGGDCAAGRYIFTWLKNITRYIYRAEDDIIAVYKKSNMERDLFYPIIPMVLVNGGSGIGYAHSSTIPNYCPKQIIQIIRKHLQGQDISIEQLHPHYRRFQGEIIPSDEYEYTVRGVYQRVSPTEIHITEIPIGVPSIAYKMDMERRMNKTECEKKGLATIRSVVAKHTDIRVYFVITASEDEINFIMTDPWKHLCLERTISTKNMTMYDIDGQIHKFRNPMDIVKRFITIRHTAYIKRKEKITEALLQKLSEKTEKIRFLKCALYMPRSIHLIAGDAPLRTQDIIHQMETHATPFKKIDNSYSYILGQLNIHHLTLENLQKLEEQYMSDVNELETYRNQTVESIWLNELNELEKAIAEDDAELDKLENSSGENDVRVLPGQAKKGRKARTKKEQGK